LSAVVKEVHELIVSCKREGKRVGVLATDETAAKYTADVVKSVGSRFNSDAIALNLFKLFERVRLGKR